MAQKKLASRSVRKEVSAKVEEPKIVGTTFTVLVTYAKLPGIEALHKKFPGREVPLLYDGRTWTRHASCATIDETPGEREFIVADIPAEFRKQRVCSIENTLAEYLDRLGYRYAIETEAVEFADAQSDVLRENWIFALGSSASYRVDRQVAELDALPGGSVLGGYYVVNFVYSARLLLVRKSA